MIALALATSGCVLKAGGSAGFAAGTTGQPRSQAASQAGPTEPAPASRDAGQAEYEARREAEFVRADKLKLLFGKPVDEAERLARSWGIEHVGTRDDKAIPGCGFGVVCLVNEYARASEFPADFGVHQRRGRLDLFVNKHLDIAAPPRD